MGSWRTLKRTGSILLLCAILAVVAFRCCCFARVTISYEMPRDGELTLGLFDKNGALLRWVVQDSFRSAGAHKEAWDGLDQWGKPAPEGDCVLKAIYHSPLSVEYKMTACNPGNPPWPIPDGKGDWLSDEANPQAVVTDGKWVFLAAPGSEKAFSVIAVDETGQRQWGTDEPRHFHPRCVSLALDGEYLYALYSGPEAPDADRNSDIGKAFGRAVLVCYDKRTGKLARFSRADSLLRVATWPHRNATSWLWDLRNQKAFTPAAYGGQPRYACTDVCESTDALGLAAAGGRLYVSLNYDNKLLALDEATGNPAGEEIPLDAPAGLFPLGGHALLAVSGKQIVKVDLNTKTATPLIRSGLVAPDGITTDEEGNIYVSDWGTSFQVKAFAPDGRFLHAVGREGGRPWVGKWDPNGMLVPRGIAVTDAGKLWVAEDDGSPPRISVWDAKSGIFLKDYIGPAPYGGGTYFWIDPHDPTRVNAEGTRFKVDFGAKTSFPEAIVYRRRNRDDPFTPNGHNLQAAQVRILYHGGREYAIVNVQPGMLSILRRDGDIYHPVAAVGAVGRNGDRYLMGDGTGQIVWDSDVGHRLFSGFFPDCFRGHAGDSYSWSDTNGDNLVQPGEMRWIKAAKGPYQPGARGRFDGFWGIDISPDWSVFFVERFADCLAVFRLDPGGWTADGAPLYDMAKAKPILFDAPSHGVYGLHVTSDKRLVVSYSFEGRPVPDALRCYDLDGHPLWAIAMPKQLAGDHVHANNAVYDFQVPKLGDVICTWLYHGSFRPFLITSDGLYVGTLLDSTLLGRSLQAVGFPIQYYVGTFLDTAPEGPTALWSESAKYFYQSPDGRYYIINGGNDAEHVLRIDGLETGGRFQISPASLAR